MYKEYVEWDVVTWKRALDYWESYIHNNNLLLSNGLEIGGRNGGLCLFFVQKFDSQIICSDYESPSEQAKTLHKKYNVENKITYSIVNCTNIPYPDNSFDFVVFKSVLGAVGRFHGDKGIQDTFQEIRRVLKPGGVLLFAENLEGTIFHKKARSLFVKWGDSWRYMKFKNIKKELIIFSKFEIKSTGFLSAFIPNNFKRLRNIASYTDSIISHILPSSWKYVSYGFAKK